MPRHSQRARPSGRCSTRGPVTSLQVEEAGRRRRRSAAERAARCCSTAAPSTAHRRGPHRRRLGRARVRRARRVPGRHGRGRAAVGGVRPPRPACCRCGLDNGELVVAVQRPPGRQHRAQGRPDPDDPAAGSGSRSPTAPRSRTRSTRSTGPRASCTTSPPTSPPTRTTATDLANFTEVTDEAPVVRFVNLLINQAITDRASDIHIEPTERDLRVRYRIDGVLHDAHRSPKNIQNGVISRLKIMADMNIAERRVPAGRPDVGQPPGPPDRPARRDAADRVGREGRRCGSSTTPTSSWSCATSASATTTTAASPSPTPSRTG